MRSAAGVLGASLALCLGACATTPAPKPATPPPSGTPHGAPPAELNPPTPPSTLPTPPVQSVETLAVLPGWAAEDHAAALKAFRAGCGVATDPALKAACVRARALGAAGEPAARRFFEEAFRAEAVPGEGVLTAYFAPAYEARPGPDAAFSAPVRGRPSDLFVIDLGALDPAMAGRRLAARLTGGKLTPYPDRTAIESDSAADTALGWMRPEDLFFLQIQGSGTLYLPDGRRLRATYAGDNGRPFVAIARPMVEAGLLTRDGASGEAIRAWLAAHRGAEADALMRKNPRYVFFSVAPDDGAEPPGAAGVPLTPGRSIAVDPARHGYGGLYWIDASAPVLSGAQARYRRLVVALDTGAAIRGEVRADLYTGRGEAAGREAGRVRHTLHLTRLIPIAAGASGEAHTAP